MAIVVVNDGCYGGTDALISILLFIFGFCFWVSFIDCLFEIGKNDKYHHSIELFFFRHIRSP